MYQALICIRPRYEARYTASALYLQNQGPVQGPVLRPHSKELRDLELDEVQSLTRSGPR